MELLLSLTLSSLQGKKQSNEPIQLLLWTRQTWRLVKQWENLTVIYQGSKILLHASSTLQLAASTFMRLGLSFDNLNQHSQQSYMLTYLRTAYVAICCFATPRWVLVVFTHSKQILIFFMRIEVWGLHLCRGAGRVAILLYWALH